MVHHLRLRAPALLATSVLLLTGCGALGSPERGSAEAAAQEFLRAVGNDPGAACELLAPETLEELEDAEGSCEQALPQQDLASPTGDPSAEVFGKDAIVHVGDATVFLARFRAGWRVTAAGCTPVPDRPYDCTVEGG